MLWVILQEYLRGVRESLSGIAVLRNIDENVQQHSAGCSPLSNSSDKPGAAKQVTVLEERRRREQGLARCANGKVTPGIRPRARSRLLQCMVLNIGCIVLVKLTADFIFFPVAAWVLYKLLALFTMISGFNIDTSNSGSGNGEIISICQTSVIFVLNAVWILPIFLITRVVNAMWFQDIANAVMRSSSVASVAKSSSAQVQNTSISRSIADIILSILLETCFLLQAFAVTYLLPLPYVAQIFSFVHLCLLYSLYAFEYAWISNGVELSQRLHRIEANWPYHMGFGTILLCATLWPSNFVVSGCLFGALFPFFIVSSFASSRLHSTETDVPIELDNFSLKLFAPSVSICNKLSLLCFRGSYRRLRVALK